MKYTFKTRWHKKAITTTFYDRTIAYSCLIGPKQQQIFWFLMNSKISDYTFLFYYEVFFKFWVKSNKFLLKQNFSLVTYLFRRLANHTLLQIFSAYIIIWVLIWQRSDFTEKKFYTGVFNRRDSVQSHSTHAYSTDGIFYR